MSFLPSVECGKFKSKQAFQSGKILACSKKSEICASSTLKLIKGGESSSQFRWFTIAKIEL